MQETPITATLLKIAGTTVPGIATYKVSYNHLWKDAERTMSGSLRAALIGIFPKIEVQTREVLTRAEVQAIYAALETNPYFSVEYWDPATDSVRTATYYAADWEVEIFSKNRGLYKAAKIVLTPTERR